ncbi:MAG: hypothetical protein AB1597_02905 [Chloroflexota bacterium]
MISQKTVDLLESFVSGRTNLAEFGEQVADLLFELRQTPQMTVEKSTLSRIQLYLHEMEEGSRDDFDIYRASLAALESVRPSNIKPSIKIYQLTPPTHATGTLSNPRDVTEVKVPVTA